MKHKSATVISYCSNDYRWIKPCIEHSKPFSSQIILPVCDHFFNGEKEDMEILERTYKENIDAEFIEFEYDPESYRGMKLQRFSDPYNPMRYMMDIDPKEVWFWHQMQRLIGFKSVADDIDYVLFLDADEIVDTQTFITWLDNFPYHDFNAIKFEAYFYKVKDHYANYIWEYNPFKVRRTF